MNINFNLGNGQAATEELAKICKQYYQCENCPITQTGAIKIDGVMVSCSTEIVKYVQRQKSKNV